MNQTPPAFLVCGSPRTGTTYLARVLQRCGLNVGHEGWWRILTVYPEHGLEGDVSCLGTFDNAYQGRVLAQVRDPRKAIPSIYRDLVGYGWHSTVGFYHSVAPDCTGDHAVDAARIWHAFTARAVQRAEDWWRVEDIGAELLGDVFDINLDVAQAALDTVPKDTNRRSEFRPIEYPWPGHSHVAAALTFGEELGYQ